MSKHSLKAAVFGLRTGIPTPGFDPGQPLTDTGAAPMGETGSARHRSQITGNAGLNFAAWQLSRRGWHVMPTIRNARGSDLIVTDADETRFFGVQSKALSKRYAVPLGANLADLRSDWWIITLHANSDAPVCFVLRLDDVRDLASQDKNGGKWWLEPKAYDQDEFREAWHRLEGV